MTMKSRGRKRLRCNTQGSQNHHDGKPPQHLYDDMKMGAIYLVEIRTQSLRRFYTQTFRKKGKQRKPPKETNNNNNNPMEGQEDDEEKRFFFLRFFWCLLCSALFFSAITKTDAAVRACRASFCQSVGCSCADPRQSCFRRNS